MKLRSCLNLFFPSDYVDKQWKIPLNLSIGFHVLIFAAALIAPSLFTGRPQIPEFYTVNLINVTELPKQATSPKESIVPEKPKKEIASVTITKQANVPSLPAKVVSLRPVKRKIKQAPDESTTNIEKMKLARELERLRAEQELRKSREQAEIAAKDALAKLRHSLQQNVTSTTSAGEKQVEESVSGPAGPEGPSVEMDEVMKKFYAAVYQRIQDHWVLPPLQNWDDSLLAILVINVSNNGTITKSFFERKSDNVFFNQFVMKIIKEAAPLPPFPAELKESHLEIGLRFTPAGVL